MTTEQIVAQMLEELKQAETKLNHLAKNKGGSFEHRMADDTVHHLRYTFAERLAKAIKETK